MMRSSPSAAFPQHPQKLASTNADRLRFTAPSTLAPPSRPATRPTSRPASTTATPAAGSSAPPTHGTRTRRPAGKRPRRTPQQRSPATIPIDHASSPPTIRIAHLGHKSRPSPRNQPRSRARRRITGIGSYRSTAPTLAIHVDPSSLLPPSQITWLTTSRVTGFLRRRRRARRQPPTGCPPAGRCGGASRRRATAPATVGAAGGRLVVPVLDVVE
jgi:hypothetical protein